MIFMQCIYGVIVMFAGIKHCGFLWKIQQKCVQVPSVTGEKIQPLYLE